jgi:hypothetical protein
VFSNGIIALATIASILIIAFGGETSALIPLYAIGVFTSFTLSQAGMVRYHRKMKKPGWKYHQVVSGVGASATFVVFLVVAISKFTIGAWIPMVLIPMVVVMFKAIKDHYRRVAAALEVPADYRQQRYTHTVVVLVGGIHRGVLDALSYARSLSPDRLLALTVVANPDEQERITQQWEQHNIPIELRTLYSPYRELSEPVLRFLDELDEDWPDDVVTVIVPDFVLDHWWENLLHNQSALALRSALRNRPNTVVVAIPTHLTHQAGLGTSRRRLVVEPTVPEEPIPADAGHVGEPAPDGAERVDDLASAPTSADRPGAT